MPYQRHAQRPAELNCFDVFTHDSSLCSRQSFKPFAYRLIATVCSEETCVENRLHSCSVPSLIRFVKSLKSWNFACDDRLQAQESTHKGQKFDSMMGHWTLKSLLFDSRAGARTEEGVSSTPYFDTWLEGSSANNSKPFHISCNGYRNQIAANHSHIHPVSIFTNCYLLSLRWDTYINPWDCLHRPQR